MLVMPGTSAFADTSPYELYCPHTPVGNIVLNNVVTTGTITPASPAAGSQFNLTNYQTTVSLPTSIVSAAQALGNSAISGTAVAKVDATGATPASISSGTLTINSPIPSPIPSAGLSLMLPTTAGTVGPFTASGGTITLTVDPSAQLSLNVSGSNLQLTCTAYPNNTAPTGITTSAPSGAQASPVIATTSAGGGGAPGATATTAATPTTAATSATTAPTTDSTVAPATSPSSGLASTGPGPHLWLVAVIGFIVLYLGSVALAFIERPRSLLRRALRVAGPAPATVDPVDVPIESAARVTDPRPASARADRPELRPSYPKPGGSQGLWFEGWEPDEGG
jgi:hypothetical protein